eukprot:c15279_g1_i3.p1 GENE.c15279_g1_i3~~c15279_g1_i3.p1  ORF type:complete len:156 (+),score=20.19 c15279_g1_i3:34-468(+)
MASMQELVAAITEGKVDSIPQILQSSPFLLNARLDSGGTTPLILAAMRGREGVVRLLLEMGANVQAHDDAGMTPLHVATQYCRADVAKVLIENGALLDVQNNVSSFEMFFSRELCNSCCDTDSTAGLHCTRLRAVPNTRIWSDC